MSDEGLARGFAKYPTLLKAKVIREKRSGKSKVSCQQLYCSGEEKELLSVNPVPVCPLNRVFIVVVQCYLIGADVNGFETMTATQLPTYLHIHTHCPTPTPGKTKTFEPPSSKTKKGIRICKLQRSKRLHESVARNERKVYRKQARQA